MGGKSSKRESTSAPVREDRPKSNNTAATDKDKVLYGRTTQTTTTIKKESTVLKRIATEVKREPSVERERSTLRAGVKNEFKTTVIQPKKENALVCAAVDFGTTYSGYAYSFLDKPELTLTNVWYGSNTKTPTVVLMDPKKRFHSFGERAVREYQKLFKTGDYKNWYYFEKFKMKLFVKECPLHRDMEIEDILGKSMKAIEIFTAAIKFIREHLLKALNDSRRDDMVKIEGDTDIRWLITVPAIWNDLSKFFMRDAAIKAGIPNEMLTLALEPEAASLFCKKELGPKTISTGCKYMVVDLGGGTADITCHEVQENETLKEIHAPCGGDFGGTSVNKKFLSTLTSILGAPTIETFKRTQMNDYLDMMDDFEKKKRTFNGKGEVRLKCPLSLKEMYEDVKMRMKESFSQCPKNSIQFKQDKMIIPEQQMREIFAGAVDQILDLVHKLTEEVEHIDHIIMAGGFSESPYIQKVMKENFDNLLTLPKEPSLAVLKGAIIYGHETRAISSRTCRYTYGIARMIRFIPGKHPDKKKVRMGGFAYCDDAFNKHIEIGNLVSLETAESAKYHEYYPAADNQNMALLEVYKSEKRDPMFVDEEGCELVGYIKADDINPHNDKWCKLLVRLIFGGTELIVEIKDEKHQRLIRGTVDFLG